MTTGQWLTVVAVAFVWGWLTADWRRDSLELSITTAATAAANKTRATTQTIASDSARRLETKLEALANAQPREIRTEMVKPVFTNVCVSDEFVRLFNEAADNAGRTLSGKPENKMPGDTTAP
ncbi:MAG: hypothetical protein E6325_25720 [Enterobacteriaceae bacterium]|nr:hypothetical protein [Enterobacteriaceae bacterium]